jgi:hypothetical protein
MMDVFGFRVAYAIRSLSDAKWLHMPFPVPDGQPPISRDFIEKHTAESIRATREACILCDMDSILPEIDRLEQLIWPPPGVPQAIPSQVAQAMNSLLSRLQDELKQQFFFHLTQQDVPLFMNKRPFGDVVAKKFSNASADIISAGSCLALQQPTACVFHLMRAMEVAVRQLGMRLKATITPQTTWRQMTGSMDPKIKAMPETTVRQKRKKNDWEAARANLHHVGSVWRNNTMHPATSYTQSQALDVLNAVRVFMSGLSSL